MGKNREEEYLRRMRALGYEPSLAGMDDEDIEWELNRMDGGQQESQPMETMLNKGYRPVDRDFAERIFKMFARPFDPNWRMPDLDGPEYRQPPREKRPEIVPQPSRGNIRRSSEPVAQTMDFRIGRDDVAKPVLFANAAEGGQGAGSKDGSLFKEPKLQSQFQEPKASTIQLENTFPSNKIPQEEMKVSNQLVGFIKRAERPGLKRYKVDENGNETIGYGHEIQEGEDIGDEISEEQADQLLMKDLQTKYGKYVNGWARENNVKLTQQQFDALVSLHYNLDINQAPTLMARIKRGDATPQEIRDAFVLYHTSKGVPYRGLWTRRADEADMYLDGDYRRKEDRPVPEGINFR